MELMDLPERLRNMVEDELDAGERIEWLAQPSPTRSVPLASLFPVLFGILWTAFAVFWIVMASGLFNRGPRNEGMPFALFGIPFVLVGMGMLCSPFWMRRRMRKAIEGTAYVITDRRVILFDNGFYGDGLLATLLGGVAKRMGGGINIRSYFPADLKQIERTQRDDGTGNILFGEVLFTTETNGERTITRSGFFSIPETKEVERRLRELASTVPGPAENRT
jgi:hypothetical protein